MAAAYTEQRVHWVSEYMAALDGGEERNAMKSINQSNHTTHLST